MKRILSICLIMFLSGSAIADDRTLEGMSEARQLGITAGLALACNAGSKLDDFELIASRIIANKALTAEAEQQGYREFAEEKLRAYNEQRNHPRETCGGVLDSFNRLPIFRSTVYADGSVKMYDGTFLKPIRPVAQSATRNAAPAKKAKK